MQGTLAVVSQSGQTLSFFDLASGERTAHLTNLAGEPHELAHDKRRNLLYLSHTYRHGHFWEHGDYSHEISIINCATKSIEIIDINALGPHGLFIDEAKDTLWASVEELEAGKSGGLISIDLSTRQVTARIETGSKPHWFAMTPDGRKAYTCNKTQPYISVVDIRTGSLRKIVVPSHEEPSMSADGKFVFFPTPGTSFGGPPPDPCIKVIDTATDEIVNSIPLDLGALSVYVTARGLMVGKYKPWGKGPTLPGKVAFYDQDLTLVGEAPLDSVPLTMRSTPDGNIGFVANILSGRVTVVDLITMNVIQTLDVDTQRDPNKKGHQGAHGMAFIP
ncbi:MAG: hypothetical protein MMC23_009674 [Stictis urceolatum]|nr:hypothetical protein [Stictis urceolata]